jgi:hypothetical protein
MEDRNGPEHCGECHTPRGFLMEVESGRYLGGGQVGPWFAPNITTDVASGIGNWTRQDIVQFLRTGSLPGKARTGGSMGEAVRLPRFYCFRVSELRLRQPWLSWFYFF